MSELALLPPDALAGVSVAVSVSDSADLARLGLHPKHVSYAVSETARAVLTSGGNLVYGGRLQPPGFTQFLMHELRRYGGRGQRLVLCLAHPEHRRLPLSYMRSLEDELEPSCRLRILDPEGNQTDYRTGRGEEPAESDDEERAVAYSAMRRHIASISGAQVVVGGRLAGFHGAMPGILEETIAALAAGHPVYVAGGFGGAAALVVRMLRLAAPGRLPDDLPTGDPDDRRVREAVAGLVDVARDRTELFQAGLDDDERARLAWSHRPGDIASLVALGLARTVGA